MNGRLKHCHKRLNTILNHPDNLEYVFDLLIKADPDGCKNCEWIFKQY